MTLDGDKREVLDEGGCEYQLMMRSRDRNDTEKKKSIDGDFEVDKRKEEKKK